MLGRRFLLIVAVLMGLTALAASVAPRERTERSQPERTQPAPTESAGAPTLETIRLEISADETDQRVVISEGDSLALEVTSTGLEAVRMLGEIDAVTPNTAARFHIVADTVGEHPIELVGSGQQIGTLVVR